MSYRALIVEDQADIAQLIKINLQQMDIECDIQNDGKNACEQALNQDYDILILDVMLPRMSGLEICKAVRFEKPMQSIIMLTAKNSELDRVLGLELGADDYMAKPFSVLELQARVKSQLRKVDYLAKQQENQQKEITSNDKPNSEEQNQLTFENLSIDIKQHLVKRDDKKIDLTNLEFDLLLFLAKSPGEVFSRSQLLDHVWGYHHAGYEHTVNSHINRLRKKVEEDIEQPKFIQTVWGVGYKFSIEE